MVKSEIASSVIRFVAILPFSLHSWASGNFMKKWLMKMATFYLIRIFLSDTDFKCWKIFYKFWVILGNFSITLDLI